MSFLDSAQIVLVKGEDGRQKWLNCQPSVAAVVDTGDEHWGLQMN